MRCEETNDEFVGLSSLREAGPIQEETVIHAFEQQQLRLHAVSMEIKMALYRSAHVERTRSREEKCGREFLLFILVGPQGIYRLSLTIRRCQRSYYATETRPQLS